jgi:2-hydroxychromene-2-carboxylate isomerase
MTLRLDFYFFIGSTYTHLSVHRAGALAAERGVELVWRPFSLRTLLREQNNTPFLDKPAKMKYMWRDLERRARRFGVPFIGPVKYPIDPDNRASHLATLAAVEGWCEPFVRAVYQTWFVDGLDPGTPEVLERIVATLGRPADSLERAQAPEVVARYAEHTDTARALGLFGAPTFVHEGRELFWGDDRLEEALDWACAAAPSSSVVDPRSLQSSVT